MTCFKLDCDKVEYILVYAHGSTRRTPMGVDYVVTGFDMKVQPLVTHNAA